MKITINILDKEEFTWEEAAVIMNKIREYSEKMLELNIGTIEANGTVVNKGKN